MIPAVTADGQNEGSPDGNARFALQENGQVFADGDEQKPEPVSGVEAGIYVLK